MDYTKRLLTRNALTAATAEGSCQTGINKFASERRGGIVMRSTIGITEKNSGHVANWRALIILAAVAGGVAALLAGGFNWRAARAAAAQQSGTWTHCATAPTCSRTR